MSPEAIWKEEVCATMRFAVGVSWLGPLLVSTSPEGIRAILLGSDPDGLARELRTLFPDARLIGDNAELDGVLPRVSYFLETPSVAFDLPLDIRGTTFQRRVWEALRQIPAGTTATYTEIAARIGQPGAVRAVARACAANVLAVAIPCHRVIRADGSLSGYRWGVERKRQLLHREQEVGTKSRDSE